MLSVYSYAQNSAFPGDAMHENLLTSLDNKALNAEDVILLYQSDDHSIYWIGAPDVDEEIPCNTYLMVDGDEGFILEPGGLSHFRPVADKVEEVFSAYNITHLLLSHQDPDVCASLPSWLQFNPDINVVCPHLWERFLPHYMAYNINFTEMTDEGRTLSLQSGSHLQCISAPYLHSPGNMVVFDSVSGFLFSGDIGAAISQDEMFRLFIDDWQQQIERMQGFHQRYMGSTRAAAEFVKKVSLLPITAMLPQHGQIFRGDEVRQFLDWFETLPCGIDYLYPEPAY